MFWGIIIAVMIVEELYIGPTDTFLLAGNLNFWGIVVSFTSLLLQFKAANYEIEKKKSSNKNGFPFSIYYKKMALQSLEIAVSINFSVFVAYWTFIFP